MHSSEHANDSAHAPRIHEYIFSEVTTGVPGSLILILSNSSARLNGTKMVGSVDVVSSPARRVLFYCRHRPVDGSAPCMPDQHTESTQQAHSLALQV